MLSRRMWAELRSLFSRDMGIYRITLVTWVWSAPILHMGRFADLVTPETSSDSFPKAEPQLQAMLFQVILTGGSPEWERKSGNETLG